MVSAFFQVNVAFTFNEENIIHYSFCLLFSHDQKTHRKGEGVNVENDDVSSLQDVSSHFLKTVLKMRVMSKDTLPHP
jgi:hypothetical protein